MTLETKDDRTLFFDLLPLRFEDECGLAVRLKVFTVPGQVIHASTRRLVVQGADGVAIVADSRRSQTVESAEAVVDLRNNLEALGIQFNKRDLPDIRREEEISAMARRGREPVYLAVATKGQGVVECFLGLLHLTWADLEAKHQLERKFGFDGNNFVRRVAEKLGQRAPVTDLLGRTLGDATRVAREVAPQ